MRAGCGACFVRGGLDTTVRMPSFGMAVMASEKENMTAKVPSTDCDETVAAIRELTRERLVEELMQFKGAIQLDFTEEFLSRLSDEKLRHVLLAAYLHGKPHRMPEANESCQDGA